MYMFLLPFLFLLFNWALNEWGLKIRGLSSRRDGIIKDKMSGNEWIVLAGMMGVCKKLIFQSLGCIIWRWALKPLFLQSEQHCKFCVFLQGLQHLCQSFLEFRDNHQSPGSLSSWWPHGVVLAYIQVVFWNGCGVWLRVCGEPSPSQVKSWLRKVSLFFAELASQVVLVVKNPPANAGDMRLRFDPWVRKIPWRKAWQPTPVFLPGESHGQRSLVGYSSRGCKKSDTSEVT